jgi:hypothetical protein
MATTIREWLKAVEVGRIAEHVEELREEVAVLHQRQVLKAVK